MAKRTINKFPSRFKASHWSNRISCSFIISWGKSSSGHPIWGKWISYLSFFLFSVFIHASSDLSLLQLNFLSIVWLRRERISTNHPSKFNTYLWDTTYYLLFRWSCWEDSSRETRTKPFRIGPIIFCCLFFFRIVFLCK